MGHFNSSLLLPVLCEYVLHCKKGFPHFLGFDALQQVLRPHLLAQVLELHSGLQHRVHVHDDGYQADLRPRLAPPSQWPTSPRLVFAERSSTSTAALFCLSPRYGLISLSRFESSGALVVGLAPCGTGHTSFDLCRYKSTHVCSTIRLGIDEINVTSLVDKESRKRSSILREKKRQDNWEGVHWISGTVQSEEHGDADADVGEGGKAVVGCRKASHEGRHDHHLEVCLRQQNTSWTRRRGGEGGLSSSGVLEHRLRPRSSNRFPAPSSRKKLRVPRPQRVHPGGPQRDR